MNTFLSFLMNSHVYIERPNNALIFVQKNDRGLIVKSSNHFLDWVVSS